MGLYFTPQVVGVVVRHAGGILAGIAWALSLGLAFGLVLARLNRGTPGLDAATTYFAGAVGGASEMALLAERHGGRVDLVASAHSVRILLVVLLIPFGFQALGLRGLDPFAPGPAQVHGSRAGAVLIALTCAGALVLQHLGKPTPWVLGSLAVAATLTA
ncbi:MAG: hypothetical protein KatS3mg122_1905 [Caldimonas sp.]|nr:MAG: hypothetical protein KatS3mg122_1905 [Caldimonas sp.]